MCGIVGYIGSSPALPILLQGLRDLEYRGYDSSGVAIIDKADIQRTRAVGKVDALVQKIGESKIDGSIGIAHTRWATHGGVTEANAHPHLAGDGKLALVHNGIIENYRELKDLLPGVILESETDTEILAALINSHYKDNLAEAVQEALGQVRGTYGIVVMHADNPHELVAARMGSPLAIGVGENEYYIASDVTPLLPYTRQVVFLDDGETAIITEKNITFLNLNNEAVKKGTTHIEWNLETAQKGGFDDFMLKEIFDQPVVFEDAIRGRYNLEDGTAVLGGLNMTVEEMHKIDRIQILAEGTSRHVGLIAKYAFERLARLPVEVDYSSEFRYRDPVINNRTLVFALSQSGETVDTLMALREAKRRGATTRGVVNVIGSTIARETGAGTYIHAGPELAVASTKAYTNMLAVMFLYALQFGRLKHTTLATGQRLLHSLIEIPSKMNEVLKQKENVKRIAEIYKDYPSMIFLGRGLNHPTALEGALKLKEISYIHAEGFAGGEMKHGPMALISAEMPIVAIVTKNSLYEKMKSNIQEARARGAKIIAIATQGDETIQEIADAVIFVPQTVELLEPFLNTIPLQMLSYYTSKSLGRDVDRPRNLAKSVTVE